MSKLPPFLIRIIIVKVLLILGVVAVVAIAMAAEPFTVTARDVDDRKAVFATVESVDTIDARTRIGGTLSELTVDEGTTVESGQLIARVTDPKLGLKADALDARIASLESERDLAATALERARKLRKTGAVAQSRLDEAQTAYDVAVRNLKAMRSDRKVIEEQRGEGAVYAPASGRVIKVPVTKDAVVLPGEKVATIAANAYILRLQLPERHARFLKVGDQVDVGARGLGATGSDQASGTVGMVEQIYPEIRQGRVIADVTVPGLGDFFVGERVEVFVATGKRKAFVVPRGYVFHRFGVGFVKLESGVEAVVQTGRAVDGGLEILSGVKEGDVLLPVETKQ